MAKKKSAGGFNMAEAIRAILSKEPGYSTRETIDALRVAYPGETINEKSAGVAFSNARKKLGITPSGNKGKRGGRKVVKKRVPGSEVTTAATTKAPSMKGASLDLAMLQAAAKYVSQVGDADVALEAVRQVVALQITK